MRRGQLGRRIEYYTHPKYGGHVPIYLDAGKYLFSAVIGDITLQDENLNKLRKMIDESLKNQTDLKWLPIIQISFGYTYRRSNDDLRNGGEKETCFRFTRYWIAQKIDRKWIEAEWDVEHWPMESRKKIIETGDRLERSKSFDLTSYNKETHVYDDVTDLKLPYIKKREDRDETPVYYIPYTEPLWQALQELAKRMDDLQHRLIKLLGSAEKREQLVAQISNLFPAYTGSSR